MDRPAWGLWLSALVLPLLLLLPLNLEPPSGVLSGSVSPGQVRWNAPAWAGPVEWQEVEPTEDGRQWWDSGSVRRDRDGFLTVLSRYTPETDENTPTLGSLYVMQIDCDQRLFRDKQVNGLPRWGAQWEPAGGDGLIERVIDAVCRADLA